MTSQSSSGLGPISQQYAAAATVPLIKSPSLWLPKPVELPGDIHPLPEDITAYVRSFPSPLPEPQPLLALNRPLASDEPSDKCGENLLQFVYPFSLENHVLNLRPSPHEAISSRRAKNAEIIHQREREEEQREKEALHKLAPGYNPSSLLVPSSKASASKTAAHDLLADTPDEAAPQPSGSDPMDDLVARLEEMESKRKI